MTTGYKVATLIVMLLFGGVLFASYYGWGVSSDASIRAQQSVRGGSIHGRRFVGGGPGFGK
jgi:hypothetical protein